MLRKKHKLKKEKREKKEMYPSSSRLEIKVDDDIH